MGRPAPPLPSTLRRALLTLGSDIQDARRRRRLTVELLARRALISRTTLHRILRGDPAVSMGSYASVLFVLGLADRLAELAAARHDEVGLALERERLPQRVRRRAPAKPHSPDSSTA